MAFTVLIVVRLQHPTPAHHLALLNAALRSFPYTLSKIFAGLVASVLGGYPGARIARRDELLNGALSSVCCIAMGALLIFFGKYNGSHFYRFYPALFAN